MSESDEIKKVFKKLEKINEAAALAHRPVFGKKTDDEKLGLKKSTNDFEKSKKLDNAINFFLQGMEMGLGETPQRKEKLIRDAAEEYGLNLTELKAEMIRRKLGNYYPASRVYRENRKTFKKVLAEIEKKK